MSAAVAPGDVLAAKYRVEQILGVGGMGVVVAAMHMQLDQRVAIKFMLPEAFEYPEALARFQREARAAVRLRSEHVARVLDTGTLENGSPYIVMEYLDGTDFAREIERAGPMPLQVAAEYVVQACEAIAEAHSLGIVHRDLKPANLFLTHRPDGSPLVKVLDFGISKAPSVTDSGGAVTKTTQIMGSPLYMSPEQIRSAKDVDSRTDVWSLGVILYQFLAQAPPFGSDSAGSILSMVLADPPTPLASRRPGLPPQLYALIDRCLQKDRSMRCQSVAELATGLAPFCPSRVLPIVDRISGMRPAGGVAGAAAGRSALPPAMPEPSSVRTADSWNSSGRSLSTRGRARRAAALWSTAILVVAAIGIAAAFLGGRRSTRGPASTLESALVQPSAPSPSASAATAIPPASTARPVSAAAESASATSTAPPVPPPSLAPTAPSRIPAKPKPSRGAPAASSPNPVASATASAPASTPALPSQKPGILDTSY
jgi:serine/threonine-protein kinase